MTQARLRDIAVASAAPSSSVSWGRLTYTTYYLNNAVYLVEDFLKDTRNPYYDGEVDYGDRAEHCWNGDHTRPNATSRLRYHQMYVDKILKRMEGSAPKGADLTSWRY